MSKKIVKNNLLDKFKYEIAQEMGLNKNKNSKKTEKNR